MEVSLGATIFWVFLIFVAVCFILRIVQWVRSGSRPKVSTEARVVKVRDETGTFIRRRGMYGRILYNFSPGYQVMFELLPSGKRRRFFVRRGQRFFVEGDKGILTLQGIRFVSFERRRSKRPG